MEACSNSVPKLCESLTRLVMMQTKCEIATDIITLGVRNIEESDEAVIVDTLCR